MRLVGVIKQGDPITKSASVIGRYMKRHLHIDERWIITPSQVPKAISQGTRILIFFDDFLGTGHQFCDAIDTACLRPELANLISAYTPLAGHKNGVEEIQRTANIDVAPVEILDERHDVFEAASLTFSDGLNQPSDAKAFYYDLIAARRLSIRDLNRKGYGQLGLVYAFSHAAPDNSLPILWWDRDDNWFPLFDR